MQDHVHLMQERAREVRYEIGLAKAQYDRHEQSLQAGERNAASSHRLALTKYISGATKSLKEAQEWRSTIDRGKKGKPKCIFFLTVAVDLISRVVIQKAFDRFRSLEKAVTIMNTLLIAYPVEESKNTLDSLSTFDYISAFKQARSKRYHATAEWVFETEAFEQWKGNSSSNVIWLSGKSK